jgi:hypothetical protein
VPLCPPQIPHGPTRDRTRASTVRGQRLTAWAMARPTNSYVRSCRVFPVQIIFTSWRSFVVYRTLCPSIIRHAWIVSSTSNFLLCVVQLPALSVSVATYAFRFLSRHHQCLEYIVVLKCHVPVLYHNPCHTVSQYILHIYLPLPLTVPECHRLWLRKIWNFKTLICCS